MLGGKKKTPEIAIVATSSINGVVGPMSHMHWGVLNDNPNFLPMFKGKTVLMGRKTREILREPIFGARNIVLSRNERYYAYGFETVPSIKAAMEHLQNEDRIYVIGGNSLFNRMFHLADRLYITEISAILSGRFTIPDIRYDEWEETLRSPLQTDCYDLMCFRYVQYVRKNHAASKSSASGRYHHPDNAWVGQEEIEEAFA